ANAAAAGRAGFGLGGLLGLLALPEDLVDLLDGLEQLVALLGVDAVLGLAGQLGGLPEVLVEFGVLLEVLGLEVVGPQHPEVVLAELSPLLLDEDGPLLEHLVIAVLELLGDGLRRLGLDAGLGRVVHAAGQVAVGVHLERRAYTVNDGDQS